MDQHRQDSEHCENHPQGDRPSACENQDQLQACALPTRDDGSTLSKLRRSRLGRQFVGWGFMVLGIAGLILPILPGWIFIALGAVTLSPDVPFFARLLDRVAERVPPLRSAIERVRGVPEPKTTARSFNQ